MNEKWKTITKFPDYDVSDQGRIRSWRKPGRKPNQKRKKPKFLKPWLDKDGYCQVTLCKNKNQTSKKVHRLVLETFVKSCPKGYWTCHNNGIKTDNRLINLRWDTPKNNHADKIKHGTTNRGSQHGLSKLTEKQVLKIKKDPRVQRLIAADYNVIRQTISLIKTQKTWAWLK